MPVSTAPNLQEPAVQTDPFLNMELMPEEPTGYCWLDQAHPVQQQAFHSGPLDAPREANRQVKAATAVSRPRGHAALMAGTHRATPLKKHHPGLRRLFPPQSSSGT